jgi:hypothetical protein
MPVGYFPCGTLTRWCCIKCYMYPTKTRIRTQSDRLARDERSESRAASRAAERTKEILPCAQALASAPSKPGLGLMGRRVAERAEKFLCRAYGAQFSSIPYPRFRLRIPTPRRENRACRGPVARLQHGLTSRRASGAESRCKRRVSVCLDFSSIQAIVLFRG